MSLLPKEEISQIAANEIMAGGSMFGSAALLLNRMQVQYVAEKIAEEIQDSESAEDRMLSECKIMETVSSELKEDLVQKELDQLEAEKRRAAQQ